jgi:AraC-like DNA-binding protein
VTASVVANAANENQNAPMQTRSPRAATPIAFVQAMLLAYKRDGRDPAAALAKAQIAPELLLDPQARITALQMEAVSEVAMRELDDEALGWFSRKLPWGSYGLLCRASLGAPTLGVALKRWCRHHRLLTDDIVLHLDVAGGSATLWIEERRDLGAMREFCLVSSLRYVLGYACWAVDSDLPLSQATFPYAAPPHADVYPVLFASDTFFHSPAAGFSLDAQYLALPLRRDEAALRAMLERALLLTVWRYRHDRLLVQRVRKLLASQPMAYRNAAALALALNRSERSLHRQLHKEGASLQQIKDDVRFSQAAELLRRTDQSLKQVAAQVGFSNEKSFARAFRDWAGQWPGEYRLQAPA